MAKKKKKDPFTLPVSPGIFKYVWGAILTGTVMIMALFVIISLTMMPDTEELENPKFEVSTQIFDDPGDGKTEEIGRYFLVDRQWLTYEELNPHLVNALIATEDERYYSHSGIDVKGTFRAAVFLGRRGGASTITQQLAKQFFTKYSRNFALRVWQKLKEWAIAIEFERRYTKEEILAMYLNKYDYWYQATGIGSAARTYFGKDQKDLTVEEAAMLIGLLKNPYIYNPKINPDNALQRRTIVLRQMVKNDYLTEEEYREIKDLPIDMSRFKRSRNFDGPAPYFRAELTKWLKDLLNDPKYRKPDGSKYNIYTDGLKVYTTIDLPMQRHAEAAMLEHMENVQSTYFKHWEGKDPWTYDGDKEEIAARKASLNRKVETSERFQNLKAGILSPVINKISGVVDKGRFSNTDIRRMIREEKEPGHIADRVRRGWASKEQAADYKKIMRSEFWPELKASWNELQNKARETFNTKVKMKVFAYNERGYKTVTMTPLDSIRYHTQHLQFGSVSLDPATGFIKTWVGGINHDYFKYDHIQQSNRQIGSTFKPFIYTTAIEKLGISPCQKVLDTQYEIPARDPDFGLMETWRPKNSKAFTEEYVTLKTGLKNSMNSVSVYLMKQLGNVEPVRDFVERMGIDKKKIPSSPSICLGAADLTVMDMAGAYTVYANNGTYSKPIFVTRIEDQNGKVIYTYVPEQKKVLNPTYTYAMVDMLKHVVDHRAYLFKSEIAGKTGTTNDHVDGWFMGITPNLVTATWVGGPERWIRFRSLYLGQGAVMARPYFEKFLLRIEQDPTIEFDESARFAMPEDLKIELDCSKYEAIAQALEKEDRRKQDEFEEEFR